MTKQEEIQQACLDLATTIETRVKVKKGQRELEACKSNAIEALTDLATDYNYRKYGNTHS